MSSNLDYNLFSGRTFPSLDVLLNENEEHNTQENNESFSSFFETLGDIAVVIEKENMSLHNIIKTRKITQRKALFEEVNNLHATYQIATKLIKIFDSVVPRSGESTPSFYKFFA